MSRSDASFYLSRKYADGISAGSNALSGGSVYGIDSHYLTTTGYEIYKGRPFVEADYTGFHKTALIDEKAANTLFPEKDPIGKTMEIRGEPFTVIGLVRKSDEFQPVIESIQDYETYNREEYGMVLVPDAIWPVMFNYDEPQECVARAVSTEQMSTMGKAVEKIMKKSVMSSGGEETVTYKAEDLLEKARNKQELANSTNSLLIWIASIALLVGGIGVMNIMLVSVTERTNEIGLKKALGARNSRILAQFLTEAVVLTSLGGVLGVISGIILAQVISRVAGTPVAISVPAILLSVVFSMAIGVIFGFLPSVQAANLRLTFLMLSAGHIAGLLLWQRCFLLAAYSIPFRLFRIPAATSGLFIV